MRHEMRLDGRVEEPLHISGPVQACVHCGFCLTTCPTYRVLGREMDSPRGRIVLVKGVFEGTVPMEDAIPRLDACLGCLACVTACPSGVRYDQLLTGFRHASRAARSRPLAKRLRRRALLETLPHPRRLRASARLGQAARPARRLAPAIVRPMLDLLPAPDRGTGPLPTLTPAVGPRRARVALLSGCVQQVFASEVNAATLRVLATNGVEVVVPPSQECCGALALHLGELDTARGQARANLAAFPTDVDAVISNAAGCGSALREYGELFEGRDEAAEAARFAERAVDITVFLDRLGIVPPPSLVEPSRVAYHDACHLAHAQRVVEPPRRLLAQVGGLELLEVPDGEICCGSAGTYNIEHPAVAAALGTAKASSIMSVRPDVLALGNVGCLVQIRAHLERLGTPIPVLHTVEVLDRAYRGVPLPR
jgi:glycolate oxidase iron-sulfur subunit